MNPHADLLRPTGVVQRDRTGQVDALQKRIPTLGSPTTAPNTHRGSTVTQGNTH